MSRQCTLKSVKNHTEVENTQLGLRKAKRVF